MLVGRRAKRGEEDGALVVDVEACEHASEASQLGADRTERGLSLRDDAGGEHARRDVVRREGGDAHKEDRREPKVREPVHARRPHPVLHRLGDVRRQPRRHRRRPLQPKHRRVARNCRRLRLRLLPHARVGRLSDGSEPREAVRVDGAVAMRGEQRPTLGRENDLRVPSLLLGGAQLRDRAAHQREAVPPLCRARQRAAAAPARRPGRGASAGAAAVSRGRREGLSLVHVASRVTVHVHSDEVARAHRRV
mmetsp:Transcript_33409/g.107503  ORF Transcript_33409/g.107503 Transcript_33409/m.107503 type:complete len:250 (-) Transcript_33409:315-1064(-)